MDPQLETIEIKEVNKPILSVTSIFILFVFLTLGFASFLFLDSKQASQNITNDGTEDWKTYRNEEYGFEFKYPEDWLAYEKNDGVAFGIDPQNNHGVAGVTIDKNIETDDLRKWVVSRNGNTEMVDIKIGITSYLKWYADDEIPNGGWIYSTLVKKDGNNYVINISSNFESEKILSTFKFVDQTADWKTYRNEELGFEFKYPQGWTSNFLNSVTNNEQYQGVYIEDESSEYPGTGIGVLLFKNTTVDKVSRTFSIGKLIDQYKKNYGGSEWTFYMYESSIEPTRPVILLSQRGGDVVQVGSSYLDMLVLIKEIMSTFNFIEPTTAINQTPAPTKTQGILKGQVTIGPNCPVEREGVPCPTSPEAYASREFLVLDKNKKQVASFRANAQGAFSLNLAPGIYTITSAKTGMGFMSGSLPKTIEIKSNQTVVLNIDVDTGIR